MASLHALARSALTHLCFGVALLAMPLLAQAEVAASPATLAVWRAQADSAVEPPPVKAEPPPLPAQSEPPPAETGPDAAQAPVVQKEAPDQAPKQVPEQAPQDQQQPSADPGVSSAPGASGGESASGEPSPNANHSPDLPAEQPVPTDVAEPTPVVESQSGGAPEQAAAEAAAEDAAEDAEMRPEPTRASQPSSGSEGRSGVREGKASGAAVEEPERGTELDDDAIAATLAKKDARAQIPSDVAREERSTRDSSLLSKLSLGADVGITGLLPDAGVLLLYSPLDWLSVGAGPAFNGINVGGRLEVSAHPLGILLLSLETGYFLPGDLNALIERVSGEDPDLAILEEVGYSFMNLHVGLKLGWFFVRGGWTFMRASLPGLDETVMEADPEAFENDMFETADTVLSYRGPSVRLGLRIGF